MIICTQYVYINGKVVVKNRARKVMHSKYHNKKMVTFSTLYSLYIRMKNHQSVTKSKSSDTEFNHIDSNLFLYFCSRLCKRVAVMDLALEGAMFDSVQCPTYDHCFVELIR